jgi:hypothetical protein
MGCLKKMVARPAVFVFTGRLRLRCPTHRRSDSTAAARSESDRAILKKDATRTGTRFHNE